MHPRGTPTSDGAGLQQLWLQVCASRGTPAPDPGQCARFLQDLEPEARRALETVLLLAARGREPPGELGLVSWAAACTRPALLGQLQSYGLAFSSASLFACGLALRQEGWDMQPRLAQLASHPDDVEMLRAWLPAAGRVVPGEPPAQALAAPERPEEAAGDEPLLPWLEDDRDDGPPDSHASGWGWEEPMDGVPACPAFNPLPVLPALPVLPTRLERQRPEPFPGASGATKVERPVDEPRLRLRLFGKSAAHTLEVTPHRRGGDFMGVHVVSIDSAHALGSGAGYAWERKLVLQLTPEEMPELIATLMGITPSVRFGHHGASQAKFIEVRRQEGGLVMVTGEKSLNYSVPVPAGTVYYLLELFCRAMNMAAPGRSVSDVLMLVKAAHGF